MVLSADSIAKSALVNCKKGDDAFAPDLPYPQAVSFKGSECVS